MEKRDQNKGDGGMGRERGEMSRGKERVGGKGMA